MKTLTGHVRQGWKHFEKRLTRLEFRKAYRKATGEDLHKGTLNVEVNSCIAVKEHFRIRGSEISESDQDLLFEICRIDGIWAYRIRPYNLCTGSGGHGDQTLEIGCSREIPNAADGSEVKIELFRDDL